MGAVLASKSQEIDEDKYQDEEEEAGEAVVHFIPFFSFFDSKEWKINLDGENIEEVAIASNFIIVATSNFNFLIFNLAGNLVDRFSFNGELVAMAAYENHLAYIVHQGLSFKGAQNLNLNIVDIVKFDRIDCMEIPLSPFNLLTWFGYSEEGMLIIQDSCHGIKCLIGKRWVGLKLNLTNKFWIVGSSEYEMIGILLGENDYEPKVFPKPHLKSLKINFPHYSDFEKENLEQLNKMKLILDHEKCRISYWGSERMLRNKSNPLCRYSDSILSSEDMNKKEQEAEKKALEIFNQLLLAGEMEKAWIFAKSYFKMLKTWEIAILFCGKMKLNKLGEKLKELSKVTPAFLI